MLLYDNGHVSEIKCDTFVKYVRAPICVEMSEMAALHSTNFVYFLLVAGSKGRQNGGGRGGRQG